MTPGYVSDAVRQLVRERADERCEYCLSAQRYVMGVLEVDHIKPVSRGGSDDETNLSLACPLCNNHKNDQTDAVDPNSGIKVELFHPRQHYWQDHFTWSADGTHIVGLTTQGRATVVALKLNHPVAVMVRRSWVAVGWHPPKE